MSGQRRRYSLLVEDRARPGSAVTLRICGESLAIVGLPGELHARFSALMRPFVAELIPPLLSHQA